jgi:Tfp pilus assembly protein PilX
VSGDRVYKIHRINPMNSSNPINSRGAILFGVLIIVLTISLIGASMIGLLSSLAVSNQHETDRTKALYLAEAGISHAIYMLKTQAVIVTGQEYFIPSTPFGDGAYDVKLDYNQSLIIATGRAGGTKRTIQLKYNSF